MSAPNPQNSAADNKQDNQARLDTDTPTTPGLTDSVVSAIPVRNSGASSPADPTGCGVSPRSAAGPSPIPNASPRDHSYNFSAETQTQTSVHIVRSSARPADDSRYSPAPRVPLPLPLPRPTVAEAPTSAAGGSYTRWGAGSAFHQQQQTRTAGIPIESAGPLQRPSLRSRSVPLAPEPSPTGRYTGPTPEYRPYPPQENPAAATSSNANAWGFLQYLPDTTPARAPAVTEGPTFDDTFVRSLNHYHHGDHHHNHWQRHLHHFHELHLLGSAEETLDLSSGNNMQVRQQVIPGDSHPQMRLRPDVIGRQAFEEGVNSYFRDRTPAPVPVPFGRDPPMAPTYMQRPF